MHGFKSEARLLLTIKNLSHVFLGCIFLLGATGAGAQGCFGSLNEKRCRDVEKASEQTRKDEEARKQEYVRNGGKLRDATGPTKPANTTSK
ncbi:hypothetical protein LMG26411_07459 [Cupriavidus numazuensis]|uniref:Uncharacterized protein n=1 Tax=Cupriavidus numazuensis TaxID=221992 RepID=A0ABN7QFU1_9BURK|nr:hypothetical protein LMG26411_07459 [Cupriavidus numazuensis]